MNYFVILQNRILYLLNGAVALLSRGRIKDVIKVHTNVIIIMHKTNGSHGDWIIVMVILMVVMAILMVVMAILMVVILICVLSLFGPKY